MENIKTADIHIHKSIKKFKGLLYTTLRIWRTYVNTICLSVISILFSIVWIFPCHLSNSLVLSFFPFNNRSVCALTRAQTDHKSVIDETFFKADILSELLNLHLIQSIHNCKKNPFTMIYVCDLVVHHFKIFCNQSLSSHLQDVFFTPPLRSHFMTHQRVKDNVYQVIIWYRALWTSEHDLCSIIVS